MAERIKKLIEQKLLDPHYTYHKVSVQFRKKKPPIGVPGTSISSVPNLMGEGINTHTHTKQTYETFFNPPGIHFGVEYGTAM